MQLTFSEKTILRWIGEVKARRLRATGKKPVGWNERTFYKLMWLGLINYNVRKSKAWLTPIGRRFYQEYIKPMAESQKEEIMKQFEIFAEYKAQGEEEVQDNLDPIDGYDDDDDEDDDSDSDDWWDDEEDVYDGDEDDDEDDEDDWGEG